MKSEKASPDMTEQAAALYNDLWRGDLHREADIAILREALRSAYALGKAAGLNEAANMNNDKALEVLRALEKQAGAGGEHG